MKKVFKELKPFRVTILIILGLLFIQAMANLALPDYMSNIVNIGIQQEGLDESIPEAIRQTEMEDIVLFLTEEEESIVKESYRLVGKEAINKKENKIYLDRFPNMAKENVYVLKNKNNLDKLEGLFDRAIVVRSLMTLNGKENPFKDKMKNLPEGLGFTDLLKSQSNENRLRILEEINSKIEDLPAMYIRDGSIRYVSNEYRELGVDINKVQRNYILKMGAFMLLISLLAMATSIIVGLLSSKTANGFAKNLRDKVFKKVAEFSNEEFNNFSTASLITRSTNDIQQIQNFTSMTLKMVFFAPILGIGGIIRALQTNVSMAWIVGLGVLIISLFVIVLFIFATPLFKKSQKFVDRLNLVTRESLTGMLVIRAFNNQAFEEEKFKGVNKELTGTHLKISRIMIAMMPGMQLLMNAIVLLIFWVGAKEIDKANIQVGDMMAFIQYAMQIIMSFLMLSMVSIIMPRAMVSIQRVEELLATDVKIKDPIDPRSLDKLDGVVEFDKVSFKYPAGDDYVLKDLRFKAFPGEMTAFIGSTGSGKTSLVNLIPRLYDVSEGSVKIDGVDVRDINLKDLRSIIGYVPQQALLFSGTIDSNIKYGKNQGISQNQMEKAIEIAQAEDFVLDYEKGYDSPISQGGSNVSGGQRQRLSIARAIASKPRILIFDDSFSALDFKTDKALRNSLKENFSDSTILVVAQRINTIKDAENIIVLDEGRIVGSGSHRELLEKCKVYQQIAMSQLSEEELGI